MCIYIVDVCIYIYVYIDSKRGLFFLSRVIFTNDLIDMVYSWKIK